MESILPNNAFDRCLRGAVGIVRLDVGLTSSWIQSCISPPKTTHNGTAITLGTLLTPFEHVKPYRVSVEATLHGSEYPINQAVYDVTIEPPAHPIHSKNSIKSYSNPLGPAAEVYTIF